MAKPCLSISLLPLLLSHLFISALSSAIFTLVNNCNDTVVPGIVSTTGSLPTTGFVLEKGKLKSITAPSSWTGRVWGRTHCGVNKTGEFTCLTGDCGSGKMECSGRGSSPPATLAEITIGGYGGLDFYDISVVDGYNLPMTMVPQGETGANCLTTGCTMDLKTACPTELKMMSAGGEEVVACKSACEAFGNAQFCCTGDYNSPDKCLGSLYAKVFKSVCPTAYSYAFDDTRNSTFTCPTGSNYLITFCPTPPTNTSGKSPDVPIQNNQTGKQNPNSHNNTPLVLPGLIDVTSGSSSTCKLLFWTPSVFKVVLLAALRRLCRPF